MGFFVPFLFYLKYIKIKSIQYNLLNANKRNIIHYDMLSIL